MGMNIEEFRVLERLLWPKGARRDIWMIVDAARDRRIFGMLLDGFYSEHTCLFSGPLAPELEVAAPYLVRLEYDGKKTRQLIMTAWGNAWGVFLKCDLRAQEITRHLRALLLVQDPKNRTLVFRYYDPRILRAYLPTCTDVELETVFGDIQRFWMEDETPAVALSAGLEHSRLVVERTAVALSAVEACER